MSHPRIAQLSAWLRTQLRDATEVHLEGLDNVNFGYSAELLTATIVTVDPSGEHRQDVVIRLRPKEPGLLEPYNLPLQFNTLRALEKTDVKAPRGLFLEPNGDVLGRPFFVMDRLPGGVYEWDVPATSPATPPVSGRCA